MGSRIRTFCCLAHQVTNLNSIEIELTCLKYCFLVSTIEVLYSSLFHLCLFLSSLCHFPTHARVVVHMAHITPVEAADCLIAQQGWSTSPARTRFHNP